ncbi:hypothetical protein NDA17_006203 [Ustilago hordei]|nr:hypothetical protein NDA17_006203 [Ustilago hordei]
MAKPYWIIRHHGSTAIRSLSSHPSLNMLAAGDDCGLVSLSDLTNFRPRFKWKAHTDSILTVVILSRTCLLTHSRDNTLKLWKLPSSSCSSSWFGSGVRGVEERQPECVRMIAVNGLNFSKCSYRKGFVALPNTLDAAYIDVIDINTGIRTHEAIGKADISPSAFRLPIVMSLHLTSNTVIAGYEDGWLKKWTLSGSLLWQKRCHSEPLTCLDISQHLSFGMSVAADDRLVRFSLHSQHDIYSPDMTRTNTPGHASIAIAPNGTSCALAAWNGSIRVYSVENTQIEQLSSLHYHTDTVECLAFAYVKIREDDDDEDQQQDQEDEDEDEDEDEEDEDEEKDERESGQVTAKNTELILAAGGRDGKISLWKYQ